MRPYFDNDGITLYHGSALDPFSGSGTTGIVAQRFGCKYVGIELNEDYLAMSVRRFPQPRLSFTA